MIYFKTITDCILSIKDDLKVLQLKNIRITDLDNYQKFCNIFSIDKFRSSIREYRVINGRENLKQDLRLILSAIKDYSKFYDENLINLNSVDTFQLLDNLLKPVILEEQRAYNRMLPVNKSITELKGNYESVCWKLSWEHSKAKAIFKKIEILEREKKELKDIYLEWYEDRKELIKKYSNHLSFKFYDVLLKLEIIENIIEQDYVENIELLSLNFNNDLLEIINEYFTPPLTAVSAKDFFNEIQLSGINVEKKKMSKTKFYFFVLCLSETIKNRNHEEEWIDTILNYFGEIRDHFDKKKNHEKTICDKIKISEEKQNHFAYKLLNAIKKV